MLINLFYYFFVEAKKNKITNRVTKVKTKPKIWYFACSQTTKIVSGFPWFKIGHKAM